MIKKLKHKFIAFTTVSIAALLLVVLGIINFVNFSLVASDADRVLDVLENGGGSFGVISERPKDGERADERRETPPDRPLAIPDSPEMKTSMRYLTAAFYDDGSASLVARDMSVVGDDDALAWAETLKDKKRGWTKTNYRFRTYRSNGVTYVTIIDFSRELAPSFNVLYGSIVGVIGGLIIVFVVLNAIGERLVKPYAEGDEKQKRFIAAAAREIRSPLTVLALENELIKDEHGEDEHTQSIDRQIDKLTALTLRLNELLVFGRETLEKRTVDLAATVGEAVDATKDLFKEKGIELCTKISPAKYNCDGELILKALIELLENAAKFSKEYTLITLFESGGRISITVENDDDAYPDGDIDRAFDRFYKAEDSDGNGMGLAIVKEIIDCHGGRVRANKADGKFVVKIEL